MDYFSLYESFGYYKIDYIGNPKFMISAGIACVILGVLILVIAVCKDLNDRVIPAFMAIGFLVVGTAFIVANSLMKPSNNRLEALNSAAFEGCGDSIENVVYNVEYLSDKYDERLDYFKFAYGDNAPSRKEYINSILNGFYGKTVSSDSIDYKDELKEVETSLRKGIQ